MIIYEGPSMLDGQPIVAIATGLGNHSRNSKIGAMAQIWILRADIAPVEAARTGADKSICGSCKHRGTLAESGNINRTCYVTLIHGPRSVHSSYVRGIYPKATPSEAAEALRGARVRLGAYGDPAAVPVSLWRTVLAHIAACTGYTHQWRSRPTLQAYVMASCDTELEFAEARAKGWRTFRVRAAGAPRLEGEVICPASHEAGKKTVCASCLACGGHSSKARAPIVIVAHGSGAKYFAGEHAN